MDAVRTPLRVTEPPIRCAIVTPVFAHGGVERWICDLIESTSGKRVQWTELCILEQSASGDLSSVRKHGVTISFGVSRAYALAQSQDVVVAWGTIASAFWSIKSRARLVLVAHGDASNTLAKAVADASPDADLMVRCSPAAMPIAGSKVICNAVDTERLRQTSDLGAFRRTLGVADGDRLLGFIGRMSPDKNPSSTIDIIASLPKNYHLVLVGEGEELAAMMNRVQSLKLTERVHSVGVRSDIGDIMRDLDALLVTSTQEGFGYVIAEAWAVGTLVYSTNVGAAAIWPSAVIEINTQPNVEPQPRWRGGCHHSHRSRFSLEQPRRTTGESDIIDRTIRSDQARMAIAEGHRIVDADLSLEKFGEIWESTLAELVGLDL